MNTTHLHRSISYSYGSIFYDDGDCEDDNDDDDNDDIENIYSSLSCHVIYSYITSPFSYIIPYHTIQCYSILCFILPRWCGGDDKQAQHGSGTISIHNVRGHTRRKTNPMCV